MPDVEKVIKGLESCPHITRDCPQDCPYEGMAFCLAHLHHDALELLKESKKIIDMYHKADSFLEAHGWKWETIIADSTNPDKKDGEQEC